MMPIGINRIRRVAVLEQKQPSSTPRWHRLYHRDDESDGDAIAAYETQSGPIGDGNVIMRVIISKPGERPKPAIILGSGTAVPQC